ncbi:hypothetical protein ACQEWB_22360 [Streptomyces sp. CA-249302]|uniref:hypothetical protein n=1 Tax=Streptomyces sp. CA-249302 TaxID=3240058 RepID=UPI003D8FE3E9
MSVPAPSAVAPAPEQLVDHRGAPRGPVTMPLSYEAMRLSLAFHEAGHAVLALAYDMRVLTSEVIAWTEDDGRPHVTGLTTTEVRLDRVHPWRFAAQCAAGSVAQVQYLLTHGLWTPQTAVGCTAAHDREQAIDVLAEWGYRLDRDKVPVGGKSWAMVRGMARRKISHLWPQIRITAHALSDHTTLSGDDIAALTGMRNPAINEGAAA